MKRPASLGMPEATVLAATLVLTLVSARALAADPAPSPVERGRTIVNERCSICHATGPQGNSANPAAPPFRKLGDRYPGAALDEAFAKGLMERHPAMPAFRFNAEEMAAILAYLHSVEEVRGV